VTRDLIDVSLPLAMKCLKHLLLAVAATVTSGNTMLGQGIGLGLIPHGIGAGQGAGMDFASVAKDGRKATEKRRRLRGGAKKCKTLSILIVTGSIQDNAVSSEFGYATKVDVFEKGSRKVIGTWYEQVSYVNLEFTEGVGTVVLVFQGGDSAISLVGTL
jgi:hypothetical protein